MTTITSISVTPEDKRNIAKIKQARPGVPLSYLIRELLANEAARLEHIKAQIA